MEKIINDHIEEIKAFSPKDQASLEAFRIKYLGKNGILNDLFNHFKSLPPEKKKETGSLLNNFKIFVTDRYASFKTLMDSVSDPHDLKEDPSLQADFGGGGARHPLSLTRTKIINIFSRIGFSVVDGPEIENDWYNFSALNFPHDHPARDMQDTVFIEQKPDILLRTHTSSVQIRYMQNNRPPIRIIMPGRVYRNEAISARAHVFFHQIEGLYIDKDVSFADLKQTLLFFSREMFDVHTRIRLRPSYFPFTEPSAEMDISCNLCDGKGCNMCKKTGWVEILGCGMVDPNVLENCGIDSKIYSGFAFGMGIERITNLKYSVKDLRFFSENDIRFLNQFKGVI